MQWSDEGQIVLGSRRHGEGNGHPRIDDARGHGTPPRALVRGGAGSRLRPVLQAGNAR